jgi:radical SAM superfamily enzyme YgiQ (UPF0313 family)
MRIVFVYPRWTSDCGFSAYFARRALYPPLNLALLAALAQRKGHQAFIIDAEGENIGMDKIIDKLRVLRPDAVACTGMTPFYYLSEQLCQLVKKEMPWVKTIIGGQHITIMKEKAFSDCFDYAFIGECETSFGSFLTRLECHQEFTDLKGILYRRPDIKYTGQCEYVKDLNDLPIPARELLPWKKYKLGTLKGRLNFTAIQSIRGCPWKCIFCHSAALNASLIRKRDPNKIVDEMEFVSSTMGTKHFVFLDDVLTVDRKHIKEICYGIITRGLDITFEGGTRANLVDEKLVKLMKKAGLVRIGMGLETVDSDLRDIMGKKVPLHYYSRANKILNDYDVEATNSIMFGLPGETPETIRKTLDFLKHDKNVKQANVAIAMPYPGTKFFEMAKHGEHGMDLLTEDFSKYRRYGSAVSSINGMSPQDLLDFQNEGFVSVYSSPWRWKAMIRKNGVIGGLLMLVRVFRLLLKKVVKNDNNRLEEQGGELQRDQVGERQEAVRADC